MRWCIKALWACFMLAFVSGTVACKVQRSTATVQAAATSSLVEPGEWERYKKALPAIAAPRVAAILKDPETIFYDDQSMPKTYQDTVGDVTYTPIGMRLNSDGAALIVPEGKNMFSDDGKTWSFPFAVTAGTDASTNTVVINFIHLPRDADGKSIPIAYRIEDDPNGTNGLGLHRWSWAFPVGTMVGELVFIADGGRALLPIELRTRERQAAGWSTNIFRPFPTAASLVKALKAKGSAAAAQIENRATLKAISRKSEGFGHIQQLEGFTEELPEIEPSIVRDLLTTTPFVSSYGTVWRKDGAQTAYAPTTRSKMSIVPDGYEAGAIEVTDESCIRCHKETGRMLKDIERERTGQEQTILYGDLWGADQIFSFHLFDITKYNGAALGENRALRPEFSRTGIAVAFDGAKHTVSLYPGSANWPGARPGEAPANPNSGGGAVTPGTGGSEGRRTPPSSPGPSVPTLPPTPSLAEGRNAFDRNCGSCHPKPESDPRLKGAREIPAAMRQHAASNQRAVAAIEEFLRSL